MLSWFIRWLLIIAGEIANFFVQKDALNFSIVQMVVGILIFTLVVMLFAFWPEIKKLFKKKNNNE